MAGLSVMVEQSGPIPLAARFSCAPGEVLALVGPSGSGKTTVLRIIAGVYRPHRGQVRLDGTTWLDTEAGICLSPHRRPAGMVFQSYALFPHMTAIENLMAAMDHVAKDARRKKAVDLLALVRLAGLEDRRPAELSGGQQQRVAVARALAREPRVLLLDEPFSAVDKATREKLYRELALLRQEFSIPLVLVTHDIDEALMLADRLCLLHHGRSLQQGQPLDVVQHPVSIEAARLIGHRNIFFADIKGHDPARRLSLLRWNGRVLEAALAENFAAGARVAWLIPPSKVVLHRRDRPSRGEAENPVSGVIAEHLILGDMTLNILNVDGNPDWGVSFHVPRHVAERNRLGVGETASVSLLADAIHVMPAEESSWNGRPLEEKDTWTG
jgi:molybdate transport system ATP-binding protein